MVVAKLFHLNLYNRNRKKTIYKDDTVYLKGQGVFNFEMVKLSLIEFLIKVIDSYHICSVVTKSKNIVPIQ